MNNGNYETPLIRGAVRESLRMFPVATFIARILSMDGVIGNYHIPQHVTFARSKDFISIYRPVNYFQTAVVASMYSIGRDAVSFPNPNTFQPSRWLRDSSGNLHCVHRPNMPYAMGIRSCVGQKLANSMMHTLLSKVYSK